LLHCHLDRAESADDVYDIDQQIMNLVNLKFMRIHKGKKCTMTSFDVGKNIIVSFNSIVSFVDCRVL